MERGTGWIDKEVLLKLIKILVARTPNREVMALFCLPKTSHVLAANSQTLKHDGVVQMFFV